LFHISTTFLGINVGNLIILAIFLIASITDFWDGYLARKHNLVTDFGKFLDPIADKLLVVTALIMLVEMDMIPSWIPIIIIAREFMVSGIRMIAAGKGNVIAASWYGKVKTVSQMIAISLAFIDKNPFIAFIGGGLSGIDLVINILMSLAMIVSVIATIWSGADYFMKSKDFILKTK
ncbi:MAG: CDP-diacylglycerol--glycerol-3-phosphate 3-phosphatidyltransferase, partial [Clostridia bacterium]|nr:CDP-diacylglycerol--glycerol-3-phosphate 3-phosphatidyltransferase [Clostridia bacterium]